MKKTIGLFFLFLLITSAPVYSIPIETNPKASNTIEITLNDLKIIFNKQTGSIISLYYPGPGEMLNAMPGRGGLIDIAYPIPKFEALRMASRFSKGAQIKQSKGVVVISWDNLGASRTYFNPPGKISAKVWLKAMPDGRSVSMKCKIENHSERSVGQVLFPDFHGLLPFAGRKGTKLRSCGFIRQPFVDVGVSMYPEFYAPERTTDTRDTYLYTGGQGVGDGNGMIGRWLDYGGLHGGISIFPKIWADGSTTKVRIFRLEKDPNVRLMYVHNDPIKPGEVWESPEYVLTPHRYGWAKGIKPYQAYVKSNINRLFPVPKHVREGLGFRTIYMSRWYPADGKRDRSFTFTDLPKIAKECKANGIDQLVIWHWVRHFILPIPDPYYNLGTPEELSKTIDKCEEIGVNVSLAISISSIGEPTASWYGMKVGKRGWTYHPEMIPRFQPPYTHGRAARFVKAGAPEWQQWSADVLKSVKHVFNTYTHSITWDQGRPEAKKVIYEFLPLAKKNDSKATYSTETNRGLEAKTDYVDFTWNWQLGSYHHNLLKPYRDVRAFNATFPAPRLNYNINRNAQDIKYAFMDNSYVNIMPSEPDGANGTAWTSNYPELGYVLRKCAKLRKEFLTYFTEGSLIGECLLNEPCPGTHINAYVLDDRVLFMVMNTANKYRQVDFNINLEPWLKPKSGKYEVISYDRYGKKFGNEKVIGHKWRGTTRMMRNMDIAIYEFIAK